MSDLLLLILVSLGCELIFPIKDRELSWHWQGRKMLYGYSVVLCCNLMSMFIFNVKLAIPPLFEHQEEHIT